MKRILLLSLSAGMATLIFSSYATGPFNGGAGNHTGSAGSTANCSTGSGCHVTNNSALGVTVQLVENGAPVNTYIGGRTYRILVGGLIAASNGTLPRFGFQASVVKASDNTTQAGTAAPGGRAGIAVRGSSPQLVEHTTPLSNVLLLGQYLDTVSFAWTAPASGTGTVRVFAAMNAVNFNGQSAGDIPDTASALFNEGTLSVPAVEKLQLSVYPNPVTASLRFKLPVAAPCSIGIWDMSGRLVANELASVSGGEATVATANLKSGNYYILAEQGGKQYATSFTKQ